MMPPKDDKKRKFISNKYNLDLHEIVVLHGKVYELFKDGPGKLIQSQDIVNIQTQNEKIGPRQKSQQSSTLGKVIEIKTKVSLKLSPQTAVEQVSRELEEIESLKKQLKEILCQLEVKCKLLKAKKISNHLDTSLEGNSIASDELSVSMPILSPQKRKLSSDRSNNSSLQVQTEKSLSSNSDSNSPHKKQKKICSIPQSVKKIKEINMPILSPYYNTVPGTFSKKKISKMKRKIISLYLPDVKIIRLSNYILSKYNVKNINLTLKMNGDNLTTKSKGKKCTNSSDYKILLDFVNKEFVKGSGNKSKGLNKKSAVSPCKTTKKNNLVSSSQKSSSPKSRSKSKVKNAKATNKKLKITSSLWTLRESSSSGSSPETQKSSILLNINENKLAEAIISTEDDSNSISGFDILRKSSSASSVINGIADIINSNGITHSPVSTDDTEELDYSPIKSDSPNCSIIFKNTSPQPEFLTPSESPTSILA